jgi:glycosyltransferase involved in cell wall biosynthesis
LRSSLQAAAATLGLSDIVSFVGSRAHDQLPDWYRAADLTVLPSRSEGIPNVLRESLACGTPFVASRVGGIPEIATEPCLRLVPPGDAAALADAIAASLAARGESAPTTCSTSWTESAEALVRILKPLADRPVRRIPSVWESHAVLH